MARLGAGALNEGKGLYVCHPPGDHDKWLHPKRKCMTILGGH